MKGLKDYMGLGILLTCTCWENAHVSGQLVKAP